MTFVLAIDQGTTSSRAILFDERMKLVASAQEEFQQHYPASGWVEHDPSDLWGTTVGTCREVIERAGIASIEIKAIGITSQRETTIVWDRRTGNRSFAAGAKALGQFSQSGHSLKNSQADRSRSNKRTRTVQPFKTDTELAGTLNRNGSSARSRSTPKRISGLFARGSG